MTGNPAALLTARDAARTIAGHLAFLAETQPASVPDVRIGHGWHGGFARDFATADGERVMVAARTRQQFVDLASAPWPTWPRRSREPRCRGRAFTTSPAARGPDGEAEEPDG